jgi:hypothetical protein
VSRPVSSWLVERTSNSLAARTSRRGFLARSAVVGSALAAAPVRYVLRPGTAYAAVCGCSGSTCDCSALCCDGYTEFCCTITGSNTCPAGTAPGGWWKADGSGFCELDGVPQPRYYLDCNVVPPAKPCSCGCALGSCSHRKACCTNFRYGQCHQEIAVMGPIMCRVITCTPPWQFDPACTTTSLTDNNTRFHDGPCLHRNFSRNLLGAVRQDFWRLTDTIGGAVTNKFSYSVGGAIPVAGDWDGDQVMTPGTYLDGTWRLRNSNSAGDPDLVIDYGAAGYTPVVGDWNGDGMQTIGVFADGNWYLRNSNTPGAPDVILAYGAAGYTPVVGDWNGDGIQTIGVYADGYWYLRNSNTPGPPDVIVHYGGPGYIPVVGDWNGNGVQTIGVYAEGYWYLRNSNTPGPPDIITHLGNINQKPIVWGVPDYV